MNINVLITTIQDNLRNDKNTDIGPFQMNGILYEARVVAPKNDGNINIPYVLLIPKTSNICNKIIVESNNYEGKNDSDMLKQIAHTVRRLSFLTNNKPAPIIVPFIPMQEKGPYYIQLAKESFQLKPNHKYYRIDLQLARIIENVQTTIQDEFNILTDKKVFINGYSSSGVFAQRFALIHPELIDLLCVGGAIGTIPIPIKELAYPIGINDYQELFNKEFDMESYLKIKHRYYVGELEALPLSDERIDENGMKAPLHDMSYLEMSTPTEYGIELRKRFGIEMVSRFKNIVQLLKEKGVDINYTIFKDRTHNDESGKGVNELGDKFINDSYIECIKDFTSKDITDDFER